MYLTILGTKKRREDLELGGLEAGESCGWAWHWALETSPGRTQDADQEGKGWTKLYRFRVLILIQ